MSDIDTVVQWSRAFSAIAAICTTSFPVLYLISPWYRSPLGRALMLQSVSIALALDISAVYQFWAFTTNMHTLLLINIGILAFISVGSLLLTTMLVQYNFNPQKVSTKNVEQPPGDAGNQAPFSQ